MGPSTLQRNIEKTLAPLFFLTVAAATYFMITASTPLVPLEVPFGFVKVLPTQYWILLFAAVLLLAASIACRSLPYLWASAITLTAFVPALNNLIYPYPHDIFATVATEYISKAGVFNPLEHIFLNFPGSEIVFSSIVIVTKLDPTAVIRAYGVFYNLLLLGICYISFRRFGVAQIAALLGSLTFVLGFYTQGLLIYSSLNGFLFYILVASLVLMPFTNRSANMMLLTVFFAAMTITHAFSPFLTIAGIVGLLLGGKIVDRVIIRRVGLRPLREAYPQVSFSTAIIFLLMTTSFWAYVAFGPFSAGLFAVSSINPANLFEEVITPLLSPQTTYEMSYANFARLYAPVLFSAFAIYLLAVPDKRRWQMLLLTLGLAGTVVVAVAGYAQEFLTRIFAFALLPLSYGVSKLFDSNRRTLNAVALITLVLVLGMHIPAHYGQEAFEEFPVSTIKGAQFIAEHSHPNSTYDAITAEFSLNFYFDVYRSNLSDQQPGAFYYLLSYSAASWGRYSEGDSAYANLTIGLNSSRYNSIYSSGLISIYQG
jgi:xanthosine utilization system XapX-like protein